VESFVEDGDEEEEDPEEEEEVPDEADEEKEDMELEVELGEGLRILFLDGRRNRKLIIPPLL